MHPSKKELIYYTKDELTFSLLRDVLFSRHIKSNFTPSESFPLFIAIWPFLNYYEDEDGLAVP